MSKTSFILHLDALSVLDELDDKQAGKLFKTIKEYQMRVAERCEQDADSGFDFVVEDFVTRIAFAPFKAQFIRDNEKYEETSSTRSEAGRIGNLKRWNKDLYEDVVNGKMSLQKAEVIAKHRKTSQGDNSIANIAYKDSVSDSDKDSVSDKVEKEKTPPPFENVFKFLETKYAIRYEREFLIRYSQRVGNLEKFKQDFNDTIVIEGLEWEPNKLFARLGKYARNWIENKDRYAKKEEPLHKLKRNEL
ncbi:DUF6291 domain-containing protein [Riemerella anatipestifer]|uniref:DUF6291 domain-containing protein n=1 Tax=Riemerella anatipestifer TaxID=34085 RepID=UPI00129E269C|nr:DUF6291 domain-containing protein [Riemerella anatipestifer]MRM83395.1 hypothetical protein [Riemerella anatipestifer]